MLKTSVILLLSHQYQEVLALKMLTGVGSTPESAGCNECIRNSWIYLTEVATDPWYAVLPPGTDYSGSCCDPAAGACAAGPSERASSDFASVDIAISACPQKQAYCGRDKIVTVNSKSSNNREVKLEMSGPATMGDSCSWLIKARCGAPGFDIHRGETTATAEDVEIHFLEYDSASYHGLELDGDWPAQSTVVNPATNVFDVQAADPTNPDTIAATRFYGGELYDFKVDVTAAVGATGESYLTYPGNLLRDWMAAKRAEFVDFEATKVQYETDVAEYEAWWAHGSAFWRDWRIA